MHALIIFMPCCSNILFKCRTYIISGLTVARKNLKSKWNCEFCQSLQRMWGMLLHFIHLESREPYSSFTGKVHISRALQICCSPQSPTHWPEFIVSSEAIITLWCIMTSLLFCRSVKNRNKDLEKWESQLAAGGCWQKGQADVPSPGQTWVHGVMACREWELQPKNQNYSA